MLSCTLFEGLERSRELEVWREIPEITVQACVQAVCRRTADTPGGMVGQIVRIFGVELRSPLNVHVFCPGWSQVTRWTACFDVQHGIIRPFVFRQQHIHTSA